MGDPPTDPFPAPSGLLAGRYRVGERLGAGGMADVFRATDERLHRPVAVKVLRSGHHAAGEDEVTARARFTAEGLLAARINHPAVVSILDAGEDDGRAFLVMERMPGPSLRDRMGEGPLSDAEVRVLLVDVLGALEAAHRAGLVHRDVKPANILATDDGRWKVADFGIAQADEPDPDADDLTSTGLLVGTPRYVAPERFTGHRATPASDLYSVGVVLEEVLARSDRPAADLVAVAARARALDPARRFASASSMAAAVVGGATAAVPMAGGQATEALPQVAPDDPTEVAAPTATAVLRPDRTPSRSGRAWAAALVALVAVAALAVGIGAARSDDPSVPVDAASTTTGPSATTTSSTSTTPTTTPTVVATAPATTTTPPPAPSPKGGADPKAKADKQGKGKGKGKG